MTRRVEDHVEVALLFVFDLQRTLGDPDVAVDVQGLLQLVLEGWSEDFGMRRDGGHAEIQSLDPVGIAGFGHQFLRLGNVVLLVRPVSGEAGDFVRGCCQLVAIRNPPGQVDHLLRLERGDQVLPADGEMDRTPDARIRKWPTLGIEHDCIAAVIPKAVRTKLCLPLGALIPRLARDVPRQVELSGKDTGPAVGPGRHVDQLNLIQVGQFGIPVVRVAFHDPPFGRAVFLELECTGAGGHHLLEVALVLIEDLLGVDDVRWISKDVHEVGARGLQCEPHGHRVECLDLVDRTEDALVDAHDPFGRGDDPLERRHHVICTEDDTIVELHTAAEHEGVLQLVAGYLPCRRQVRHDRAQSIGEVVAYKPVVHVAKRTCRPALGQVEVGGCDAKADAQRATALRERFRWALETRA